MINTKEEWRDISGYEGIYQVSNLGRVKMLGNNNANNPEFKKERIKGTVCSKGTNYYVFVSLSKNGKSETKKVHRLVAEAFIPNPNNFPQVNHKDENKSNNSVSNLEWCDGKYNSNYGTRTERFTKKMKNYEKFSKKVYCVELDTIYPSYNEAQRKTNVCAPNIRKCIEGERNTAGGYHWKIVA